MATENELQAMAEALRASTGAINENAFANKSAAAAASRTAEGLKQVGAELKQIPGAVGRFASGLAQGNTEFKQFNVAIDIAAGAAAGLAKMIPGVGDALGAVLRTAGEGAKYLIGQLDEVNHTFKDFAKVGALGANGMTGLKEGLDKSGLSLQGYRKVILANSEALSAMGGMVSTGAKTFSEAVGILTKDSEDVGMELRRLGYDADSMGEAAAAFVARETRLGRAQGLDAARLAAGTAKYAKELDEIAKITGVSKDALIAQQDAAMSEARFAAATQDMIRKGLDPANLQNFQSAISQLAPSLGQGIRDLATGNVTTEAARQLVSSTGGAASKIVEDLKNNLIAPGEAAQRLQAALKQNESAIIQHGQAIGNDSGTFSDIGQIIKFLNRDLSKWGQTVTDTQNEQGKGGDRLTDATVQAAKRMEDFGRIIREITFELLPHTAQTLEWMTNSIVAAISSIPGSQNIPSPTLQSMIRQRQQLGQQPDALGPNTTPGGAATGMGGRRRTQSQMLPQSSQTEPFTRGVSNRIRMGGAPSPIGSPIQFGGASGTPQSFAGLDSSLQSAVMGAAQSYFDSTGQRLIVTSARRSREDQQRLYDDYVSGRSRFPAAPPGTSAHELGHAVDIGNYNAAMEHLYAAGLRQTVPNDPVHFQLSAATGGILSGPRSGYAATLHGTEAVVPLPDGRSIPVQNVDSGGSTQQLDRLDTIINVMRDQVSATKKLIQYAS